MPVKKAPVVASVPATAAAVADIPKVAPKTDVPKAVKAKDAKVKDVKAKEVAPNPVVVAAVAVATGDAVPVVDGPSEDEIALSTLVEKFSAITSAFKEFQQLLKAHQKVFGRMQKQSKKAERKRANARKTQSGFAKPSKLSSELCDFLKVSHGTEMARTAVTKLITSYIKEHKLNDQSNKRKILPDAALKKLLNYSPEAGIELTYFNLQRYMKHQFIKAEPVASVV